MIKGNIFNIQKHSIHDGPGIRTTVFFKGCPLNCPWCHNPESQNTRPELTFWEEHCVLCGNCQKACAHEAISYNENALLLDKAKCAACGKCVDFCYKNARELIGKEIGIEALMNEIEKDFAFYEQSGGGVTFSGGEPLFQIDFLESLLNECNKRGIHAAVDTTAYAPWESVNRIICKADLFMIDIKHMDSAEHKLYTGVPNEIILENIRRISSLERNIYIRLPIIPGINDGEENLSKTAKFLLGLSIGQINILPYHKIGIDKYRRLQREYKLADTCEPSKERILQISDFFKKFGLNVKIGG